MNDKDFRALADDIWRQIDNAYGWGDGWTDAFNNIIRKLEEAYKKGVEDGKQQGHCGYSD